ncbi:MAG TPA: hydrogenase maturation protease [Blastocatellia bacterium]|nr:hydrogenase maturation protease [Blastocatellia bacterium]
MTRPRILIACIGNIFLGDDAFGVEVAKRLAGRRLPEEVRAVDFGIRGFDLAYALMDGYDLTIFVDAAPRGGTPGTIYTIEPDLNELPEPDGPAPAVEPHGLHPLKVLQLVKSMGGEFKRLLLVGCEPATCGPEEGMMGLSEPVQAAVNEAVEVIESLVAKFLHEHATK